MATDLSSLFLTTEMDGSKVYYLHHVVLCLKHWLPNFTIKRPFLVPILKPRYLVFIELGGTYVGVLISLWLSLFVAQPTEFFLDGLKKLEQRSHKCVELRGDM
jgi:hypothetical protein